MKPMISIIIPMYNLEKYIVDCMESIRVQDYSNFEVLIVDDGSTDCSVKVVKEYIEQYKLKNFFLLTKPNGGISSARNAGLEKAKGEWILFIDGDDWIEPECINVLVETLNVYPSDLVIGGVQTYDCITGERENWSDYPVEYDEYPGMLNTLPSFEVCWGRLYRKAIIDEHNLRFDERIKYAEDNAWQFDYCKWVKSYSATRTILYNYRVNRSGAITLKLITPQMKYYIWEHMLSFVRVFDDKTINEMIKNNLILNRVLWRVLLTAVINDVLDKKYDDAKEKMNMEIATELLKTYKPRTRKDEVFIAIWKAPFALFVLFVRVYYNNFKKLRNSKAIKAISRAK